MSRTLIKNFISKKDPQGLREFLKSGTYEKYINQKDPKSGWTLVSVAASARNSEYLETLILHGGNVNTQSKYGMSPLHIACERGFVDHVKILLENGADVRLKDNWGKTALLTAVFYERKEGRIGTREMSQVLLGYGSDPRESANIGVSSYQLAKEANDEILLKLFDEYRLS